MNVYLGPELDRFIGRLIKGGLYQSQSEVVREAMRLLKRQEDLRKLEMEELRHKVRQGIRDIEDGRFIEVNDSTFSDIRERAMKRLAGRQRKAG